MKELKSINQFINVFDIYQLSLVFFIPPHEMLEDESLYVGLCKC